MRCIVKSNQETLETDIADCARVPVLQKGMDKIVQKEKNRGRLEKREAFVMDDDGAVQTALFRLGKISFCEEFLVDGGYSDKRFATQIRDICGAWVEVIKRGELRKFVVPPRRWAAGRLLGWLDKFRRFWKNCERKLLISTQVLTFALIVILIRGF